MLLPTSSTVSLAPEPSPGPVIPEQLPQIILQPVGPMCYLPVLQQQLNLAPEALHQRQLLLARLLENGSIPPAVAGRLRRL